MEAAMARMDFRSAFLALALLVPTTDAGAQTLTEDAAKPLMF
jgi:hypothetical protein